jgi:hypothetical protein
MTTRTPPLEKLHTCVMCACIMAFSSARGMRHSSTLSCTMELCLQHNNKHMINTTNSSRSKLQGH